MNIQLGARSLETFENFAQKFDQDIDLHQVGYLFLQEPAVGDVMADLYLGREPFVDVSEMDARRFAHEDLRPEFNIV